jgi:hypothetical protein
MKAATEAISSKEMGSYKASRVYIICLLHHSSHKMQPLDKAFMGPPKTFCGREIEKWLHSNRGRSVTDYQIGKLFGKYKQASTGATADNGCRTTGLFLCDINIFRPHDFPLVSRNVDTAPVNHPALVKTSNQPLFSYSSSSPFTSADALRSSDISPMPSLNSIQILVVEQHRKLWVQLNKKYFEVNQKKKIKQVTKSKTWLLASNSLLVPSERRKRRVYRDPTRPDTPSDSDAELALAHDSNEED